MSLKLIEVHNSQMSETVRLRSLRCRRPHVLAICKSIAKCQFKFFAIPPSSPLTPLLNAQLERASEE